MIPHCLFSRHHSHLLLPSPFFSFILSSQFSNFLLLLLLPFYPFTITIASTESERSAPNLANDTTLIKTSRIRIHMSGVLLCAKAAFHAMSFGWSKALLLLPRLTEKGWLLIRRKHSCQKEEGYQEEEEEEERGSKDGRWGEEKVTAKDKKRWLLLLLLLLQRRRRRRRRRRKYNYRNSCRKEKRKKIRETERGRRRGRGRTYVLKLRLTEETF